jgi:radical SAM superfamily enzyme YgiQ (UPF0313 family)
MKIVLIVPPGGYYAERWQKGSLMPALGIGYIASVLEKNHIDVKIIDARIEGYSQARLINVLRELSPDVAGLTFTTENRFDAFDTMRRIKEAIPDIVLVAGGPHVSLAAEDTLLHIKELNYVVRGEGEYSFLELLMSLKGGKEPKDVQGISFRDNGLVIHNPPRQLIRNLDEIPFPARHLFPWEKYNFTLDVPNKGRFKSANIMTSRGCPYGCNFCATSNMWGRSCRMRTPENIIEEVELLVDQYRAKAIWIFDDTFTVSKRRIYRFCELLKERKISIHWFCEIRVDTVTRDLLNAMKDAGCFSVGYGVESGSQRIIDEVIKKKIKLEDVRKVTDWCVELGIMTNPFFIFSHPEETMDDIAMTMDMIRNWPKNSSISLSLLHVYPGTPLEKVAKEKGVLPQDFSWSIKDNRVETLPSAQGNVPIFRDKLTWEQISELLFEWARIQKFPVIKKIPRAMRHIRNLSDMKRYMKMFWTYVTFKTKSLTNSSKPGKVVERSRTG